MAGADGEVLCYGPRSWCTEVVEAVVCRHISGTWPQEAEAGVAVSCAPREVPSSAVSLSPRIFSSLFPLPLRSQK